jgi:hypothetical protein
MNPFRIFSVFKKGNEFVDAVKTGKQLAITAALGALLAVVAPFLGSQVNVHPWLAFLLSQDGIQAVGALVTGVAGVFLHFGSSADRGIGAAKPPDAPAPSVESPAAPAAMPPAPEPDARPSREQMSDGGG